MRLIGYLWLSVQYPLPGVMSDIVLIAFENVLLE